MSLKQWMVAVVCLLGSAWSVAVLSAAGDNGAGPLVVPTSWTTGGKSVLVIPVGFTDNPVPSGPPEGWTNALDSLNNFFVSQSYSQFWISGYTVAPAVALGVAHNAYEPYADWRESAFLTDIRAAAKLAGYDSADYDLELVHTYIPTENQAGTAMHGGKGVWLNYPSASTVIVGATAHEIGHNLGLFHTRGFSNSSVIYPTQAGGWTYEYGGYFCTMGCAVRNPAGEFCAYDKHYLGWLADELIARPVVSGTYRVYAFDQGTTSAGHDYALQIQRDPDHTYWFEFRQDFTSNLWSMSGLVVHTGGESMLASGGSPVLLDMTPGSHGFNDPDLLKTSSATMADAPLALGRTFSDDQANLHVTPLRKGGTTPESLDVVVNLGGFPGNRPPRLSIAASTSTPTWSQTVTFTATATDPDGDPLAYYWEFDDPGAAGGAGLVPFGLGVLNPDAGLRTQASYAWPGTGVYHVRCTVTDMKGGNTTATTAVSVGGGGSGMTISGVVRDESGQPIAGAVVNNWKPGAPNAVPFGAANLVASSATASNGQYRIPVGAGVTYRLNARYRGYTFDCTVPGGVVAVTNTSVSNVDFTRVASPRTFGGTVYLAGVGRVYDAATDGVLTVHDGNPVHDATVDGSGNWRMTVPEGPVALSVTAPAGYAVRAGFWNPYAVVDAYVLMHLFVDIPGQVPFVGFTAGGSSSDDTVGDIDVPVALTLPPGYTNWPARTWVGCLVDGSGTAVYGQDYRLLGAEVTFPSFTTVLTNHVSLQILPTGAPHSRTVVLRLVPLSSVANLGALTTYTHAIIPPGADTDADGLPDEWEWKYSPGFTNLLPAADNDGDGQSNSNEFWAGTNPIDNASAFRVLAITRENNDLRVTWQTGGGKTNVVQALTGSLSPDFGDLSPGIAIPGVGDVITNYVDRGGVTNTPARFYRIRIGP